MIDVPKRTISKASSLAEKMAYIEENGLNSEYFNNASNDETPDSEEKPSCFCFCFKKKKKNSDYQKLIST